MTSTMEHEDYLEFEGEHEDYLELEGEHEHEDFLEFESEDEDFLGKLLGSVLGGEVAGPLNEHEEMELASQLLEVGSEQELEQFIGNLLKKAARGVSSFARSGVGRALGGALKSVAKRALPVVGGALGSMVAPGIGTSIGSKLGSLASGLFEMEGEINEQELEFEMARRVVRIGAAAARTASRVPPRSAPPEVVARRALVSATRRHAPGAFARGPVRAPVRPGEPLPRFRTRRPAATGYGTARQGRSRRHHHGRRGYGPGYLYQDIDGYPAGNGSGPAAPGYDADGYPESPGTGAGAGAGGGRWVRRGSTVVLYGV
jgi:uncharacterized protein (DUF697 family)